ncbi:hypothetical protein BCV70DRAFT_62669 [Testicularia cyperi]|uniref:Uncharacterized protein n=1 Tax=Testicularia cyperi TaxID=1882483 RepID=A0A317XW61_9BASI|nr:hypothetical protein BCV70DRAFT_62669 [Testicularia cyperi]
MSDEEGIRVELLQVHVEHASHELSVLLENLDMVPTRFADSHRVGMAPLLAASLQYSSRRIRVIVVPDPDVSNAAFSSPDLNAVASVCVDGSDVHAEPLIVPVEPDVLVVPVHSKISLIGGRDHERVPTNVLRSFFVDLGVFDVAIPKCEADAIGHRVRLAQAGVFVDIDHDSFKKSSAHHRASQRSQQDQASRARRHCLTVELSSVLEQCGRVDCSL